MAAVAPNTPNPTTVPGAPNWVDLGTPDLEASRRFYSDLFGWAADVSGDPQFGGYTTFKIVAPPLDVGQEGRMAVFADPTGAYFSVWQGIHNTGAQLVNAPGALSWNELTTRDPATAKRFYHAVFGWEAMDTPDGDSKYTMWRLHGQPIGGMVKLEEPADLPPLWMVYFAVEDCDATADTAARLGGTVAVPPTDNPQGRFATLNDPQGAVFSIIKPS